MSRHLQPGPQCRRRHVTLCMTRILKSRDTTSVSLATRRMCMCVQQRGVLQPTVQNTKQSQQDRSRATHATPWQTAADLLLFINKWPSFLVLIIGGFRHRPPNRHLAQSPPVFSTSSPVRIRQDFLCWRGGGQPYQSPEAKACRSVRLTTRCG